MARVRARRETAALYLDFFFQGKRCREQTALTDTPGNRRRLQAVLDRLTKDIKSGAFDYACYFPNSRNAARFSANQRAATANATMIGTTDAPMATAAPIARSLTATMCFGGFANQWYAQHEIEWKRSYRKTVRGALDQHLISRFGEVDVGRLTKEEILNFRSALGKLPGRKGKNTLSAQRINHVMGVLRRVLEDAADRFHFANPYQRIKPLKLTKSDIEPFTLAEVQQILETVRKDFQTYLLVRFFTGMRTGEVDGLKWRYVDFERGLILVRETIVNGEPETTKTYESARDIEMSATVCAALRSQHAATAHLSEFVFCNRDGKPIDHNNFTTRVWYPLLRNLNLRPRRPYQTRHTAATLWLSAGESPVWIARQMGHTTTEMLIRVYSRFRPDLIRKDGAAFERLLNAMFPLSPSLGDHQQTQGADESETRPVLR